MFLPRAKTPSPSQAQPPNMPAPAVAASGTQVDTSPARTPELGSSDLYWLNPIDGCQFAEVERDCRRLRSPPGGGMVSTHSTHRRPR